MQILNTVLRLFFTFIATVFVLSGAFQLMTAANTLLNILGIFAIILWATLLTITKVFTINPFKHKPDNANTDANTSGEKFDKTDNQPFTDRSRDDNSA